ncbi:MAG TPA: tRNA 2-selenouridine(34) synthase MnmH [Caulobacteraceae bacterium]|jgi:tRNA 2-selenouridine synthase
MSEIEVVSAADPASLAPFDAVIDVRSPAEFADDHVPGAISLPVLSNAERAEVGTLYVQVSRFTARKVGAAIIARNVAHHLETALKDKDGAFRPLIYCWRGGQRSGAMATILSQVGWRTAVLQGGYKTYRRWVQTRLYDERPALKLVLLEGRTGSGKTELLGRLTARGVQTLDLEGLAEHRGSVFGGLAHRPQPSQKMFESRLIAALDALDASRPIVVEAEASKVGDCMTPPALWAAMTASPRVAVVAEPAARAAYLAGHYADVVSDRAVFEASLERLPIFPGRKAIARWLELADAGDLVTLAGELVETHYDPSYDRAARKDPRPRLGEITLGGLDPASQEAAADEIARLVDAL